MEVARRKTMARLGILLGEFPVVAILGARQVGKTTLARQLTEDRADVTWFDLEDPVDVARLDDPGLALRDTRGLVVLDEVQRMPDLFPLLRVLADRNGPPARFLVLGSASPELLRQASETLAGRIAFHHLSGFDITEASEMDRLWIRGGFPRSYLAASEPASVRWRQSFIETFLSRDVPAMTGAVATPAVRRFWTMLAHWHGQIWNGAEFGRALGVAHTTARRHLDMLTSLFVVRQLQPWFENVRKRQVRAPKVYITDTGVLHALLGLPSREAVLSHPKVGASWEGFAVAQVTACLSARPEQCFHWSTHSGAELDLLVVAGNRRYGFEIKRAEAPGLTRSMRSAFDTLGLDRLDVIHAGARQYDLAQGIRATPAAEIRSALEPLAQ